MIARTHPHIPIRRESTYRLVAHILENSQRGKRSEEIALTAQR